MGLLCYNSQKTLCFSSLDTGTSNFWCGPPVPTFKTRTGFWSASWLPGDPSWKTGPLLIARKSRRSKGNFCCYSTRTKSTLILTLKSLVNTSTFDGRPSCTQHNLVRNLKHLRALFYTIRASQRSTIRMIPPENTPFPEGLMDLSIINFYTSTVPGTWMTTFSS